MLAKLGAVTIGDVWWHLWRGLVWAIFIQLIAALLDLPLSWKLYALCIASSFLDFMLYPRRS